MSKYWEEIGNNATVGAPKHSLAELKEHLALKRMVPIKEMKEVTHETKKKKRKAGD